MLASPENTDDLGESPASSTLEEDEEVVLRRQALHDNWREIFDRFDPEGFGEVPALQFLRAMMTEDFQSRVDVGKRTQLAERIGSGRLRVVTYQEFVNVMSGKRSRSFKCAVHHRDREVTGPGDFHLEKRVSLFQRMVRAVAAEYLTEPRDRKYYADHYRCWPPPLFIITVTLLELGFFVYYWISGPEMAGKTGPLSAAAVPVPIDSVLLYRPDRRYQAWRFITYMVLHASWWHLAFNLLAQLLVGLPLEMVHGSGRVLVVYLAGVLAGSLGTSVCDAGRQVYLVGASGGVYALLAAHIANVLLNYHNMEFGVLRLLLVLLVASFDVGFAIYHRYAVLPPVEHAVSYVAHLAGAAAGLSLGLVVLKNFQQKLHEQLLWWVALGVYLACTLFAIIFNIIHEPAPARLV